MKNTFAQKISAFLKKHKISKLSLCKKTGIPYSTLSEMLAGRFLPNTKVQAKLAAALPYPLEDIQTLVAEDRLNRMAPELRELVSEDGYFLRREQRMIVLEKSPAAYSGTKELVTRYLDQCPKGIDATALRTFLEILPKITTARDRDAVNAALADLLKKLK